MKKIVLATAVLLTGCVVAPPPRVVYVRTPSPLLVYQAPQPQPVVSVYVDPPLFQPAPIRIEWAPPPMLVETVAPMPYEGAIWTGGYWVWEGNWVWAYGRWAPPPQPGYGWVHPYYENRGGSVVFVNGFWAAPGVTFVAPSISANIAIGVVGVGVVAGLRPIGPQGIFVPAPPGSHFGLIVPAPIGTPPAVVTGVPPIIREGMRININNNNSTTANNNVTTVRNVTNITNVTIVAPPSATANGQAVNTSVPAQSHMAAAMPPVVKSFAPEPVSTKAIPAYVSGRQPIALPPAQVVRAEVTPTFAQPHMAEPTRPVAQVAKAPPPINAPQGVHVAGVATSSPNEVSARTIGTTPNAGNHGLQKTNVTPPAQREKQENVNHSPQQSSALKDPSANPPKPPAVVKAQKSNESLQKPHEGKKVKEDGKSAEKHEKE